MTLVKIDGFSHSAVIMEDGRAKADSKASKEMIEEVRCHVP